MNLKEAFRYQNKLQHLMDEAAGILYNDRNVVRVEKTALLHKVNPEAQDEVTVEEAPSEYAEQINDIAALLLFLLSEREKLSRAIREAKNSMDLDFDSEVSMNAKRQELAGMFRTMAEIRSSEQILPGQGQGFKFNAEGNQVSYRCDLKKVTTINFDRNKIRAFAAGLSKKSDRISGELDKCMVNTEVDYLAPFDVNDTFADVLQWHMDQNS
jgi:hypothetical protein